MGVDAAIKITNSFSWLVTRDENLKNLLWKSLRFRERNYFHSRLYKQKIWDGFRDFYSKKTGRFLTGLLPEVLAVLRHKNINYKLVDDRESKVSWVLPVIDNTYLKDFGITLHDHQVDICNKVFQLKLDDLDFTRTTITAPTSAGKTLIMTAIIKNAAQGTPILVLANRKSLVEQNYQELIKYGIKSVGRLYDGHEELGLINCCTVQSLGKISKVLPRIKMTIVDEIHENTSKTPLKLYDQMSGCSARIAVSATPFKFGGKDPVQKYNVKGYFGPILKTSGELTSEGLLTTSKMQEAGILSKANVTFWPINAPDNIQYSLYIDAITYGIAKNIEFHKIVARLASIMKGRSLVLVERLEHGDTLAGMIPNSLWIRGEDNMETRKLVIGKLKESKDDVVAIATTGIFSSGVSCEIMNCINASSGQADHQIIQRFGRGLRTADDKVALNYHDFIFNTNPYLLDHSEKRIKILRKEGHDVKIEPEISF